MGIVCILLVIITFFCCTGVGAILANALVEYKNTLAMALTSLKSVSDTSLMIGVIIIFSLIGLLIGMNLIMHGLTFNKIVKMQQSMKRRL